MLNIKSTKKALVTGIISMSLCSAMLVGSTYAWFTYTAPTQQDSITAGKLQVKADFDADWTGETFEPGAIVYKKVTITNEGNVNAKCKFNIDTTSDTNGFADALQIAIVETKPNAASEIQDWEELSTFDGSVGEASVAKDNGTAERYIVLKWKTDNDEATDNKLQDKTFEFGIDILAKQDVGDSDAFGDDQYDLGAKYPGEA